MTAIWLSGAMAVADWRGGISFYGHLTAHSTAAFGICFSLGLIRFGSVGRIALGAATTIFFGWWLVSAAYTTLSRALA